MATRISILWVITCLLLSACVTKAPVRKIENNIFTSDYPNIKISISPMFDYLDSDQKTSLGESKEGGITSTKESSRYKFVNYGMDGRAKRFLIIGILSSSLPYDDSTVKKTVDQLENKTVKIGGKKFQSVIAVKPFSNPKKSGYSLQKVIYTRVGHYGKNVLMILYLEDATESGFPVNSWGNPGLLSYEQRQYLQEFNDGFMDSFEILK